VIRNRDKNKDIFKRQLFDDNGEFFMLIKQYNQNKEQIFKRNIAYLELLKQQYEEIGKKVYPIDVKTESRVLCDTSSPFLWIPDEIGIAWDPILDTPIIPSSEIKGAISAVIQFEKGEKLRNVLFGGETGCRDLQTIKSIIDFTDAYPISSDSEILERDVMTPIYAKEIEEHKVSPTPVKFYVIKPGVVFRFLLLVDQLCLERILMSECITSILATSNVGFSRDLNQMIQTLVTFLRTFIKNAFGLWGIGTKTSSGYGIFRVMT